MEINLLLTFNLLLAGFGFANSQKNCESTDWAETDVELKCPIGMKEIYEYRHVHSNVHSKICCIPGTAEEISTHKSLERCETTGCANSTSNSCSGNLYQRIYNGEVLPYEEIYREECTTYEGQPGWTFLCCRNNSEGRLPTIYGAEYNEFPFMALLNVGGCGCGGVIYNKRYILLAAHCLVDEKTGELIDNPFLVVKVGGNLLSFGKNSYIVENIVVHPEYSLLKNNSATANGRVYNDIALLKVKKDFEFGPRVQSIKMAPNGFDEMKYADKAVVVGWGTSKSMQKADFLLRNDEECFPMNFTAPLPRNENYTQKLLCSRDELDAEFSSVGGGRGSGGPAICRGENGYGVLCGITSFGVDDPKCKNNVDDKNCKPKVYTEVDSFYDWIVKEAGKQEENTFYRQQLYGEIVPSDQYEHQVHITSAEGKSCGGTLINPNTVVTAAHCVANGDGSKRIFNQISVTMRQAESKMKQFTVKSVAVLDGFKQVDPQVNITAQGFRVLRTDNLHKNDLAVIKLNEIVPLHPSKFAQIPKQGDNRANPMIELALPRNTKFGNELRLHEFKILSHEDCQRRIDRLTEIGINVQVDENNLCGVEKFSGGSTCDRELGGGLIGKGKNGMDVLFGVQTYRACERSVPSGFMEVRKHANWILQVSNKVYDSTATSVNLSKMGILGYLVVLKTIM